MSSRAKRIWAALGAIVAVIYLLNPTWGVFELLPDNIPGLGNVDEVLASALLFSCVRTLRAKPAAALPEARGKG